MNQLSKIVWILVVISLILEFMSSEMAIGIPDWILWIPIILLIESIWHDLDKRIKKTESMISIEAVVNLLEAKGILTKEEIIEEVSKA